MMVASYRSVIVLVVEIWRLAVGKVTRFVYCDKELTQPHCGLSAHHWHPLMPGAKFSLV